MKKKERKRLTALALGNLPVAAIKRDHLRKLFQKIEERGALTYARDVRTYFRAIWKHMNSERERPLIDPSEGLTLKAPPPEKHHNALEAHQVGAFLRALRDSSSMPQVRIAVKLMVLLGLRTAKLRELRWSYIDVQARLLRIPITGTGRQKGGEHVVPLADETLELLARLRTLTGKGQLLFPAPGNPSEPMNAMTCLACIYRLGYRGVTTGHGFRTTLTTWASEQPSALGFTVEVVERQMSHKSLDRVRAAYARGLHLDKRRELMAAWARFCEDAEREEQPVPLRAAK